MGKARDFELGVQIERQARKPIYAKVGQYGRGLCHVTYYYNFGTSYIFGMGKVIDF